MIKKNLKINKKTQEKKLKDKLTVF